MKNLGKHLILVVSLIVVGIIVALYFMSNIKKEFKYVITYYDGYEPGTSYVIEIDNNFNILLTEKPSCSTLECMNGEYYPEPTKTEINFSSKGREQVKKFVKEIFDKQNINSLEMNEEVYNTFTDSQKKTYSAIFYNDENIMYK